MTGGRRDRRRRRVRRAARGARPGRRRPLGARARGSRPARAGARGRGRSRARGRRSRSAARGSRPSTSRCRPSSRATGSQRAPTARRRPCAGAPAASCATACPVPFGELAALDAALVAIAARRGRAGGGDARRQRGSLSCAEYLRELGAPPATREFLSAWWVMIGGTHPERGAVVDALAAIAAHGGPTGLLTALRHAPVEGWSALAERMAASPGVEVRYGAELRAVAPGRARRRARAGRRLDLSRRARRARAAGQHAPGRRLRAGAARRDRRGARHATPAARTRSGCARAAYRPACSPPARGRGCTGSTPTACSTAATSCCSASATRTPPSTPAARATSSARCGRSSRRRELVASDHHDWIADPFSRGTWATAPVGRAELLTAERFPPHGRSRSRPPTWRRTRRAGSRARCSPGAAAARWAWLD